MDLSLLFPIIILLLFVPIFLQNRKQKRVGAEMAALQTSLEPGDIVSTTSGLRGTVVDASYEDTIDLEIADGVVTTWIRAAIREKIVTDDAVVEPVSPAGPSLTKEDPSVIEAGDPAEPLPHGAAPVATAPVVAAPVVAAPVETVPVETVPAEAVPGEAVPMDAGAARGDDSPNGTPRS